MVLAPPSRIKRDGVGDVRAATPIVLNKIRGAYQWTWSELARRLGYNYTDLRKVMRGERSLPDRQAWAMWQIADGAGLVTECLAVIDQVSDGGGGPLYGQHPRLFSSRALLRRARRMGAIQ